MITQRESELYDLCRWNESKSFKDKLNECLDQGIKIDFSFDNSAIIESCIIYDRAVMLDSLLHYYKKMYLSKEKDDITYKVANYKLREMLEEYVDSSVAESEVSKILIKHNLGDLLLELDTDDESLEERIKDFDEYDLIIVENNNNQEQVEPLGEDLST